MRRKRHRLQWQLAGHLFVAMVILMTIFLAVDFFRQRRIMVESLSARMQETVQFFALRLGEVGSNEKRQEVILQYCEQMQGHGAPAHDILFYDATGEMTASNRSYPVALSTSEQAARDKVLAGKSSREIVETTREGRNILSITMPFYEGKQRSGQPLGAIHYSNALLDLENLSYRLLVNRIVVLSVTVLLILLVTWLVINKKVTVPLKTLFLDEYAVGKGDLVPDLGHPDPNNEISELFDMFNRMVVSLAEQRSMFTEMVASMAERHGEDKSESAEETAEEDENEKGNEE